MIRRVLGRAGQPDGHFMSSAVDSPSDPMKDFRMKKCGIYCLTVILLRACATSTKLFDENGTAVARIACGGLPMNTWYDKANDECPSGYFKVDEAVANVGQVEWGQAAVNPYYGNAMMRSMPMIEKSLTVRCKPK
jgi:hypothetical protein